MEDAMRALLDKLDGFTIYGYRVRVHLARHQSCRLFGRKSAPSKSLSMRTETLLDKENQQVELQVLTVESLARKLREDGLRDISIMRLAGSAFLLMFKDKESLDKAKSEYEDTLQRWFKKLSLWSEDVVACNRQTWIACQGIPVHAWNEETFKNIASIWGELISVDENTIKPTSFSRANIQILTNNFDRLNEEILLSVDSKSYRVRIIEFEPSIKLISLWHEGGASGDDVKSKGSSSESSEARLKSGVNVRSAAGLGDGKSVSGERQKADNVGVDVAPCPTSRSNVRALNGLLHATLLVEQPMQNTAGISGSQQSLLSLSDPVVVQVGAVNSERAGDSVSEGDAHQDLSLESSNMAVVCVDVVNAIGTSPAGTIMCNDENPKELCVDRAALISAQKIDLGVKIGKTPLSPKLMNRLNFPYVTSNDVDEEFSSNDYSLDRALEDISGMGLGKQETWAEKVNRANSTSTLFPEMQDLYGDENEILKDFIAVEMREK
ncbi:hypothetical protein V6N13_058489 [Hibiscus sabdariffa]|uniref:DUF4283 domain-containing protein n=1 Tax=Hibiscus sabdariffa TaxID=183260 RepID=A0ABR2GG08_9ROSI